MTTTVCGTPLYIGTSLVVGLLLQLQRIPPSFRRVDSCVGAAPEVLGRGVAGYNGYGSGVDMWAAGLILYQMLCGALPFSLAAGAEPLHVQVITPQRCPSSVTARASHAVACWPRRFCTACGRISD